MLKPYQRAELSFEFTQEIGHDGKNSSAFIACDHQLNATIVIKRIKKSKIEAETEYFSESKILYLSNHPNVVQVHYACMDDEFVYIGMPYYQNGSLKNVMKSRRLTVRELIIYGCQVACGLHNIHSKRLAHLDIKPDNILMSDRGEALISDFGQSKFLNYEGMTSQDRIYGKIIPPEQFTEGRLTRKSDIYQYGLLLYRMCNGDDCFNQQTHKYLSHQTGFDNESFRYDVINGKFPNRDYFDEHIPEKLKKIIRKCLETDVNLRYESILEVANNLGEIDGEILDWQLSIPSCGGKKWIKITPTNTYSLTILPDGSSLAEKCGESMKMRRIAEYTKGSLTKRDIKSFLGTY